MPLHGFHRLPSDFTSGQPSPPVPNCCQPCSRQQENRLTTGGISWQLVESFANGLHRLSTDSTGCQLLPTTQPAACRMHVCQQLATGGLGWQPVESVGSRWNQLPTDSTNCQPIPPIANCCQPCSRHAAGCTVGKSWQRRNRLAGGGISLQPLESVLVGTKLSSHTKICFCQSYSIINFKSGIRAAVS